MYLFLVRFYLFCKRALDILVAGSTLALLSPLLIGIASRIRFQMGTPVLFTQLRPGWNGVLFPMRKFRTMQSVKPGESMLATDGARLTHLGVLLRRLSLDELPELWNVLIGEMSLVGPRPLLPEYLTRYSKEQARRHLVRPGLTGWAQVNGRNALDWQERLKLDVWYVEHAGFLLDLRIIFKTLWVVVSMRGVSAQGQVTMGEFRGNHG